MKLVIWISLRSHVPGIIFGTVCGEQITDKITLAVDHYGSRCFWQSIILSVNACMKIWSDQTKITRKIYTRR